MAESTNWPRCNTCKGEKLITIKIFPNSWNNKMGYPHGCSIPTIVICEICSGKGYIDTDERNRYRRSMGLPEILD